MADTEAMASSDRQGRLSFRAVTCINVDEYAGLSPDHSQSYAYYMHEHLFRHVDVDPSRTNIPDGTAINLAQEAQRYDGVIEALGRIDLILLGLGANGHIAFNEPGSPPDSRTRVVDLAPATLEANSRFFAGSQDQPAAALIIGIATIRHARRILVTATSREKSGAVKGMLFGQSSSACPAATLAFHADLALLFDRGAASAVGDTVCLASV